MKLNALIVEDDKINQMLLKTFLEKNPNIDKVYQAYNGLEALETLDRYKGEIGIIFLDIKMPVMDGIEFMENIKSRHDLDYVPIIVLSTDDTRKSESMNLGAFDYMVKPIHQNDINEKIEKVLNIATA